jgi:hypothetical protein
MRHRLIPGLAPKLKTMVPLWTNKFRKKYRKKVENTPGNYTRTKPLMRLSERHPWVFRHSSKRFWVEALSFVAGVIALTIWVSVMLG